MTALKNAISTEDRLIFLTKTLRLSHKIMDVTTFNTEFKNYTSKPAIFLIKNVLCYIIIWTQITMGAFGFDGGGRDKSCRSSIPTRKSGSVNINAKNDYAYAA